MAHRATTRSIASAGFDLRPSNSLFSHNFRKGHRTKGKGQKRTTEQQRLNPNFSSEEKSGFGNILC